MTGPALYLVRLTVPRRGSRREWEAIRGGFESDLAAQESAVVTGLRIDSELRRGRDYVRVLIVATVKASDIAEAFGLTWQSFRQAADKDLAGWDLAGAAGEARPAAPLRAGLPRRPLRRARRQIHAPKLRRSVTLAV